MDRKNASTNTYATNTVMAAICWMHRKDKCGQREKNKNPGEPIE